MTWKIVEILGWTIGGVYFVFYEKNPTAATGCFIMVKLLENRDVFKNYKPESVVVKNEKSGKQSYTQRD